MSYRFDPVDKTQLRLLGQLSPARRLRLMLDARELAAGLIRGRLRRRYPNLSQHEINMKLLRGTGPWATSPSPTLAFF